jgi:hypothetical protein
MTDLGFGHGRSLSDFQDRPDAVASVANFLVFFSVALALENKMSLLTTAG